MPIMADTRTQEQRRRIMQSVGQKDTLPEMLVRRLAHALGHRFRLHRRDLPGRPDLVFPRARKVIFVHGCYWHGHGCAKGQLPKSRIDYWGPKIARNRQRDAEAVDKLESSGWSVMTIWQCEAIQPEKLLRILKGFLGEKPDRHVNSADVLSPSREIP
jgi:DNA mismatch endonuclease (patch repair protein)